VKREYTKQAICLSRLSAVLVKINIW